MKYPILLIAFLLASITASAQDYNPLTPGVNRYFINSAGHLRGMRIDSIVPVGANLVYYPYHSLRGNYNLSQNTNLNPNGGSWFGKAIIQLPDGTFLFDNIWLDTVIIKTQAHTGDSWIMYNDTTQLYYQASLVSEDTTTILGTLDSIKTIRITAHNNLGQVTTDPINNMEIKLSKNHGFAQILDLHTFPYHKANIPYQQGIDYLLDCSVNSNLVGNTIYNIIDFQYPTQKEMYNWNVGDAFQYRWKYMSSGSDNYLYDSVIAKTINGNDIIYTLTGHKSLSYHITGSNQTFYTTTYFTDNFTVTDSRYFYPSLMPEEYHHPYAIYYEIGNQDNCIESASYNLNYYSIHDSTVVQGLYYFPWPDKHKKELGRTNYYYFDGSFSITDTTLIYYHHNNITCGTFLALDVPPINGGNTVVVSPNPSSGHLRITTPDFKNKEIKLIDVYGRCLKTINSKSSIEDIDVINYPNGIYYLRLTTVNGDYYTEKVIVQH